MTRREEESMVVQSATDENSSSFISWKTTENSEISQDQSFEERTFKRDMRSLHYSDREAVSIIGQFLSEAAARSTESHKHIPVIDLD